MKISILSLHQSFILQKGIESFVRENSAFLWCGALSDQRDLENQLRLHKPHVLILDAVHFKITSALVSKIKRISPATRLLSISEKVQKSVFSEMLKSGVTACLLNECEYQEVTEAIFSTSRGERFLCGKIAAVLTYNANENPMSEIPEVSCEGIGITDREAEIIQFIAAGYSNKQIADKLFLSTHTVNTHRKNIMAKLRVNNTAGVVMYAIRNNLLSPNQFLFAN
jgi:DNA-binding NarL/FixJ family response regulator